MTDLENNKIENPQNSAEELADNGTNDQVDQNNTDERNEEVSSEQVENSTEEKVTDSDHTENSEEPKQDPVEEKPSEAVANKTPEEPEKQEVEEVSKKTESEDDEDAPFEEENQEQDYSVFSKGELIAKLQQLLDENEVFELKDDVDIIKSSFYRLHRAENEAKRREFVENGGEQVDFKPEKDPQEEEFKSILGKYKEKKSAYIQKLEKQKEDNLRKKYEVIEGIKELINGQESLNKTFEEFRK
ncbi:MAG: hypothetical protein C0594_06665 [Marinilabiliales bacterium]|nr:MAG: hypothetical protein C0594_06665 [Marinilabiliales bacterium]